MKITEHHFRLLIVTLLCVTFVFLMFRRFAIFALPLIIIFTVWFSRRLGRRKRHEDEDPADWWKKGKPGE